METLNEYLHFLCEEKECPSGKQWCTKQKKCVEVGSGDGEGPRKKRK